MITKKEWRAVTCYNIDDLENIMLIERSSHKDDRLYDSVYMKCSE